MTTRPFAVRAVDARGRTIRRVVEAASVEALRAGLGREGVYPLSIEPWTAPAGPGFGSRRPAEAPALARQIAALLEADVPLAQALELAADAATSEAGASVLRRLLARVEDGRSVAEALAQPPQLFPPVGLGMIAAGERSGSLVGAFARLADYLEYRREQRRRLLAALSYPLFMLVAGIAASALLVAVVLPRFSEMLTAAGVELPATTALLLGVGDFAARYGMFVVLALVAAALVARRLVREERIRLSVHEALFELPLVGRLRRSNAATHSGQALSIQLAEGVTLLAALESTAAASADLAVRARLRRVGAAVRDGGSLSTALAETSVFPPAFVRMVRIGERSGAVASLMHRAAILEEQELDRWMQRVIRYAEPAMIVGFGGFIGFVALALLQAVYGIHGEIAP